MLQRRERLGAFVLVPLHVAADGLAACVAALQPLRNFSGAIVSMPHKTVITELLDELTPKRSWSARSTSSAGATTAGSSARSSTAKVSSGA